MQTPPNRDRYLARIDFDLHGLVGIRLLDAAAGDVAAVSGQLGLAPTTLTRRPDVVVRFVDRLPTASPVRCLGVNDAGFTDDAFLVLGAKHKTPARVRIPFERIGRRCEIVCESGLPGVPLLIDILNLTVLANGAVPIHASAFLYNGVGVLTVGWSKGGKTETLLSFMANGAEYIGDEWVYLSGDGRTMVGIPEPIRLWDWHLRDLPEFRSRVARGALARLRAIRCARRLQRLLSRGLGNRRRLGRMLSRVGALLEGQLHLDVPPKQLFGSRFGTRSAGFDRLVLAVSGEAAETVALPIAPEEIADRMAYSLQEERSRLMSYYRKFQFAFPGTANPLLEQADDVHELMLSRALAGKPARVVYHPYPVRLPALFDAVRPFCLPGVTGLPPALPVQADTN